jgi:Na+-driven multidrug efflux pump
MVGSTFAGQNIGAGRFDRVKQGFRIILIVSLISSTALFALIYIFGCDLMRMFIDMRQPDAPQILALGIHVQRIMIWCYIIMAFMQPANGVLRGAGDTLPVMWITIVCTVFMRVPMAYLMVTLTKSTLYPSGNPDGIFWSMVVCFTIAAAACLTYYASGRWKKKALVRAGTK